MDGCLAQAFAGTVPCSETAGFISDYSQPESVDYVTFLTAHEPSHQYGPHQLVGADTKDQDVLSEALAQYSALMVLKGLRCGDHTCRYLQFELDRYLDGRATGRSRRTPARACQNPGSTGSRDVSGGGPVTSGS